MSSGNETGSRLHQFKKKNKDASELRRRRTEVSVELRKANRDDQLEKRRNIHSVMEVLPLTDSDPEREPGHWSVKKIAEGLKSSSNRLQLQATQAIRTLLSEKAHQATDNLVEEGIVPRLISFLTSECSVFQYEAAWALTNIGTCTLVHTTALVEAGAIPAFARLVASPFMQIRKQAIWALGNIAGYGANFRDQVISHGVIHLLLPQLEEPNLPALSSSYLENAIWLLCNLCQHKNPEPPLAAIKQMLPTLARLLYNDDKRVVEEACWAMDYLTDSSSDRIEVVVQAGVVPRLVQLLTCEEVAIVSLALRAVGNIVAGTDEQTKYVLDIGALRVFNGLLCHQHPRIVKDAAWAVSNVLAGKDNQIQEVINAGLVPLLVKILHKEDDKAQIEAVWAVTNYMYGATLAQTAYLLQFNFLEPLLNLLTIKDSKILVAILSAIYNILEKVDRGDMIEGLCLRIEEFGGLKKIEALLSHDNDNVYNFSYLIIDTYFSGQKEDEMLNPEVEQNYYTFKISNENSFEL